MIVFIFLQQNIVDLTIAEAASTEDFDDILYTPDDMEELLSLAAEKEEGEEQRVKRKVTNNPDRKWKDAKIVYKFDGEHSKYYNLLLNIRCIEI